MSEPVTLNPQIVGQAEKAHNAFLFRALAGTRVDEPQWITLVLGLRSGGTLRHDQAVAAVTGGAFFSRDVVEAGVRSLLEAGLLSADGDELTVTDAGAAFVQRVRTDTNPIIEQAYGDIPADDLATAARVLATITQRLTAALSSSR